MRFTNESGLPASWTMGFRRDGREQLIVIAKATYTLPTTGEGPTLADVQLPLVEADEFSGEPGESAPTHETDYAHGKLACDVLLLGSAYAPPGHRTTRLAVGLKLGAVEKQFVVVGSRKWQKRLVGVSASAPRSFERLPISYDVAFGGTDHTRASDGQTDTFEPNPVGVGYGRHRSWIDGRPLPTTEQPGQPIENPGHRYVPMAYSPCGRNWLPRRLYAGTYDKSWIESTAPLWPDDFDERYFQAAPADQQMPYPKGGEPVILRNLTPDGARVFQLPRLHMPVVFLPHKGADANVDANCDTLVLLPDRGLFTVTWRAVLPLARSVFDVKETIVGHMSVAWHRARRFPGKTYHHSLGEAVRQQRARKQRS